ncbi:MAG: S-methyl-5-thioribose-1-phosphate isomerase [Thermoproteota archaeon]|nr:MAG: S-methyl-5-thioribose-1-phosphate isomerase [Candidatus Korarchaeota archaeon]
MPKVPRTVRYEPGRVILIDQRRLPDELTFLECSTVEDVARAIETMAVRGAPAIGVTAALGLALAAEVSGARDRESLLRDLREAAERLRRTRPTAVNLFWAIDRVMRAAESAEGGAEDVRRAVVEEALKMAEEDVETNRRIGELGAELIEDGSTVMTICNAGSLATVWYGTVTAPMYVAWERGVRFRVVALETRPVLQGARLTSFELSAEGIPVTLIVDGAAGHYMRERGVDLVLVGADRILRDGTVFNKIGTYSLAVLAREHGVPFFSVAPTSTFDMVSDRSDVKIEERPREEVASFRGVKVAPDRVEVYNPAFDMTPPEYLTGIVTELGILYQPLRLSIARALGRRS